jgi:hypothetical protein
MPILGTIVNGEVKYDRPIDFPEGARVSLVLQEDEDFSPLDLPQETHEEYLESLREGIDRTNQGVRGKSVSEVFDKLEARIAQRIAERG